ncbi:hypothetical protein [Micromonospora sp. NPDC005710]|uniref:hypothetical protein n=1 Tax=Micromonospora sp. NPDC005710 TaxID=3157051 RepID=UPI0033E7E121
MRFLDDRGQFGLLVSPLAFHRLFRFQFIVEGRLVGDDEGCIIGSVMTQLTDRPRIDDERLDLLEVDPAAFMEVMATDEYLHDSTIMSSVESLDRWTVYSYVRAKCFTMVARQVSIQEPGQILVANVDEVEFEAIVNAARTYWLNSQ